MTVWGWRPVRAATRVAHEPCARALRDLVESKGPLTGAGMGRAQGQVAQILRGPTPACAVNL